MDRNNLQALLRLRHELAGMRFEIALTQFNRKYSDSQPRVPAGQPGGGQWAGGDDGSKNTRFAGGFDDEDMGKTVRQFMSEKCKAGIGRIVPGEFLDSELSLGEIIALKRRGDAAATRCIKLLNQDRFRK